MSDSLAQQALQSMEFPRQEYWSGSPWPSPGDLPDPGSNLGLLHYGQILYRLSHHKFIVIGVAQKAFHSIINRKVQLIKQKGKKSKCYAHMKYSLW